MHTLTYDKVLDYAKEVMRLGMFYMYLKYKDAIKEGDEGRVLTLWKYMYMVSIFYVSDRQNFLVEVLSMLYKCRFVCSPLQAKQLLWSRYVNVHEFSGKNIATDLHMEHLNKVFKEAIKGLGANKHQKQDWKCYGPIHALHIEKLRFISSKD